MKDEKVIVLHRGYSKPGKITNQIVNRVYVKFTEWKGGDWFDLEDVKIIENQPEAAQE